MGGYLKLRLCFQGKGKKTGIEYFEFKGVRIPIADISTMVKTKQGVRPRDKEDLLFLENILEEEGR